MSDQRLRGAGGVLRTLTPGQASLLALLFAVLGGYYSAAVIAVLLGASNTLLLPSGPVLVWIPILAITLSIGLALKRVLLSAAVLAVICGAVEGWAAIHGSGPLFPWLRAFGLEVAIPIFAGLLLAGSMRTVRKPAIG